jgi:lipopolysaccharide transport protein LptA
MKYNVSRFIMRTLAITFSLAFAYVASADDAFTIPEEDATVITSSKLTFDQEKRYALFEGDVVVTDPSLKMTADKLTVEFDETNKAKSIVAEGNVVIIQEEQDTTAWAGKAAYDVETGQIFMERKPRIRRGRDMLEGDTITFWRDHNKMICEPQARLVLYPQEGSPRERILGE